MVSIDDIRSRTWAFQSTHYWIPKIQDGWDPPYWHDVIFPTEGGPIWIKLRRLVQNDISTAMMWSKSKPYVEFQYGGRLGEFNGMSSQSHVSHWWIHCHDSRATCHIAVTWRNQCHDRATLQGVRIPSAILKIVFRHILFFLVFNAV